MFANLQFESAPVAIGVSAQQLTGHFQTDTADPPRLSGRLPPRRKLSGGRLNQPRHLLRLPGDAPAWFTVKVRGFCRRRMSYRTCTHFPAVPAGFWLTRACRLSSVGFVFAAMLAPSGLMAQPSALVYSANSSADYSTTIAQGSLFVVFGYNLGPATLVQVSSFPLPNVLSGTSVTVTFGSTTLNCPMIYTSSAQVAAIRVLKRFGGSARFT